MAEIKNESFEQTSQSLKKADSKKSQEDQIRASVLKSEAFAGKKSVVFADMSARVGVKRKLPVAVDIIAGILMLIIVCGIIVGTYMLFRYFSNDYESADITYTVEFSSSKSDFERFLSMKNEEVFVDKNSNAVFFGKITNVETAEANEKVRFTIKANVKYRRGEGYSIEDTKIAVGNKFALRCGETRKDVTVIALDGGN